MRTMCGVAALTLAFGLLAGCAPSDSDFDWGETVYGVTIPCTGEPDQWLITDGTYDRSSGLEVGSTVECSLWAGSEACRDLIASVEWETTVPGIVSLAPGPEVYETTVTAEAPGTTRIRAEVTYRSGRVVPARRSGQAPDFVVVPASES